MEECLKVLRCHGMAQDTDILCLYYQSGLGESFDHDANVARFPNYIYAFPRGSFSVVKARWQERQVPKPPLQNQESRPIHRAPCSGMQGVLDRLMDSALRSGFQPPTGSTPIPLTHDSVIDLSFFDGPNHSKKTGRSDRLATSVSWIRFPADCHTRTRRDSTTRTQPESGQSSES